VQPPPYDNTIIKPFAVDKPGRGAAYLLSLDGRWIGCTVTRYRTVLVVEDEGLVAAGMSGSPIVATDGKAIGLVSTGVRNPVLHYCLPAWFFRRDSEVMR
jgi:hypothetical protein